VLAAGEIAGASGRPALLAIILAYELLGGLGHDVELPERGFDQGTFTGVATALAVGKLLGLTDDQLANAASLALVPSLPLAAARWGTLSMWKGCAEGAAVRNGVFAALLARAGMTGPPEPFEGVKALWEQTGPFEPRLPVLPDGPRVVQMSHTKPAPAETWFLGLIDLAPKIRAWTALEDIASIDVELPDQPFRKFADEPKYDPTTSETADHSLPYTLAAALVDGSVSLASYEPERIADPTLRPLMRKIRAHPSEELTRIRLTQNTGVARPLPVRVTVRTTSGQELRRELMGHRGHMSDPMTRADVNAKLDQASSSKMTSSQRERIRAAWWAFAEAPDVREPIQTLATFATPE
jgi:2-methylcitrate dehydratase